MICDGSSRYKGSSAGEAAIAEHKLVFEASGRVKDSKDTPVEKES